MSSGSNDSSIQDDIINPDVEQNTPVSKFEEHNKQPRKCIRVLTVCAYLFSVSMAAIMLSLYYIFIWDPQIDE